MSAKKLDLTFDLDIIHHKTNKFSVKIHLKFTFKF